VITDDEKPFVVYDDPADKSTEEDGQ